MCIISETYLRRNAMRKVKLGVMQFKALATVAEVYAKPYAYALRWIVDPRDDKTKILIITTRLSVGLSFL